MKHLIMMTLLSALFLLSACDDSTTKPTVSIEDTDFELTDWTTATHSKSADPDFAEVFDNTQVKRFDISITSERWQLMKLGFCSYRLKSNIACRTNKETLI